MSFNGAMMRTRWVDVEQPAGGSGGHIPSHVAEGFGRLKVADSIQLFQSKFPGETLIWDEATNGTGASAFVPPEGIQRISVAAGGDYVVRQTFQRFPYQNGRSIQFLGSAIMPPQADVVKRLGPFASATAPLTTPVNGAYWASDGTTMRVEVVKGGALIASVAQADWNHDKLDGTGPSGANPDFANMQMFFIEYVWLGTGFVRFGLMCAGAMLIAHVARFCNTGTGVMWAAPFFPMRAEIAADVGGVGSMDVGHAEVAVEEGHETPQLVATADVGATVIPTGAKPAQQGLLAFRTNPVFTHLVIAFLRISLLTLTSGDLRWFLCRNPTIAGFNPALPGSWTTLPGMNGQYAVLAAANDIAAGAEGHIVASGYFSEHAQVDLPVNLRLRPGMGLNGTADHWALAVQSLANSEDVVAAVDVLQWV